jgi:hypothetical protein
MSPVAGDAELNLNQAQRFDGLASIVDVRRRAGSSGIRERAARGAQPEGGVFRRGTGGFGPAVLNTLLRQSGTCSYERSKVYSSRSNRDWHRQQLPGFKGV